MQLAEVGKLLAIIRSFDNRKLDESTAMAWKMMLDREVPDAQLCDAQEVVMDWFSTENPYFEVRHLVDGLKKRLRLTPKQIADDVRSAIARGLLPHGADPKTPVSREIAAKLAEMREASRVEAERHALDSHAGEPQLQLRVGRDV